MRVGGQGGEMSGGVGYRSDAEDVCPRCKGRLHSSGMGSATRVCPWCDAVLDGTDTGERSMKRVAIVGVVIVAAGIWAMFIPADGWNATSGLVFGVVTTFLTAMAWVLSGPMVDN